MCVMISQTMSNEYGVVFNNQDVDGGFRANVGVFIGAVGGALPGSWGGGVLGRRGILVSRGRPSRVR